MAVEPGGTETFVNRERRLNMAVAWPLSFFISYLRTKCANFDKKKGKKKQGREEVLSKRNEKNAKNGKVILAC